MRTLLAFMVPIAAVACDGTASTETLSDTPRSTIDIGVHVSDIAASAQFYADVIGLTEVEGFDVSADFATAAGLTHGQPLSVRVFVPREEPSATRLKLMAIPDVETSTPDNTFVHSHIGIRYLTIFIDDTRLALARLRAAGIDPVADGPILIGEDPAGNYLTVVRDPDGNLVELIGPMR